MINILSVIAFSIFIILFLVMLFKLIKFKLDNQELKVQIINNTQEIQTLKNFLDKRESSIVEKTDGFLNFVTQSRDWAFEYIENAQQVISKVISDTEFTIDYHNKFRSMEIEPYQSQLDTLSNAIQELKPLLPKEESAE